MLRLTYTLGLPTFLMYLFFFAFVYLCNNENELVSYLVVIVVFNVFIHVSM